MYAPLPGGDLLAFAASLLHSFYLVHAYYIHTAIHWGAAVSLSADRYMTDCLTPLCARLGPLRHPLAQLAPLPRGALPHFQGIFLPQSQRCNGILTVV